MRKKNLEHTTAHRANVHAGRASHFAGLGRFQLKKFKATSYAIQQWHLQLKTAPVLLYTLIFFVALPVEIMVSFEMYRELLTNYSSTPPPVLVWLLGLFIAGTAAFVSHLLSNTISQELYQQSIFTILCQHEKQKMLWVEAEKKAHKKTKNQFASGLIIGVVLLMVVGFISWQRSFLMGEATGVQADFSLFEKILPIFVILIEILTGIYLTTVFNLISLKYNNKRATQLYEKYKALCLHETQMAYTIFSDSNSKDKHQNRSKDMNDVLYRTLYRDVSSERYLDYIELYHNNNSTLSNSKDQMAIGIEDENNFSTNN